MQTEPVACFIALCCVPNKVFSHTYVQANGSLHAMCLNGDRGHIASSMRGQTLTTLRHRQFESVELTRCPSSSSREGYLLYKSPEPPRWETKEDLGTTTKNRLAHYPSTNTQLKVPTAPQTKKKIGCTETVRVLRVLLQGTCRCY